MRVKASLRHQFQLANSIEELNVALEQITSAGPIGHSRCGLLPEMHVAVPSGPVDRW
jgi:hypothetical protein